MAALCLLATLAIMANAGAQPAHAPAQALRIIVPLPAGGTSDLLARLLADSLEDDVTRPVIVENRPGASGRIAVEALRSAAPDGSTVMLAPFAVAVLVPLTLKDVHYDPVRDLVPVAQTDTFDYALAVASEHPALDLAQLIAWMRANPDRATFGTPGAGSVPQFIGTQLGTASGRPLLHVPYRGAARLASDVMGGQVSAAMGIEPAPSRPDVFAARIATDTEHWRRLVKAVGFVAE